MEFYLDADNDEFSNIQVSSLSDDVSLGYVHSNVEQGVLGPLSNDDIVSLDYNEEVVRFMINGTESDLILSPNKDINGAEFIEFRLETQLTLVSKFTLQIFSLLPLLMRLSFKFVIRKLQTPFNQKM